MQQDLAEIGAMRALAWLAAQEDLVGVFLGSTGTSLEDLRAPRGRAGIPRQRARFRVDGRRLGDRLRRCA